MAESQSKQESAKPPAANLESDRRLLDRPLDTGSLEVDFNPADLGMAPLLLEILVPGQPAPADLYLALYNREQKKVEMKLAGHKGEEFKAVWRDHLLQAGQNKVYVKTEESDAVTAYFDRHAREIIDNPTISMRKKATFVQEMASLNLRLLFASDMKPKVLEQSVSRAQNTVDEVLRDPRVLENLSEILRADYTVYTHCANVCLLAMGFGWFLNLPEPSVRLLGMGGLLHDVGMAKLPAGLIDKAGPLDNQERAVVQTHPRQGYLMLQPISSIPYDVLMMVLHHHENADGTGYPARLKAERTPKLARLLRVADAYDAMTSKRPYQDAKPAFDAAATLVKSMTDIFGADITPAFVRFLGSPFFAG